LHCADCGTVFENKYDSECKVCGSTRKSYKTPQPADWKPYEEPKKRKKKSGIKISKRTLAILTLFMIALTVGIVTTIDDISNPPDDYASNSSNDFNKNTITISYNEIPPYADSTSVRNSIQDAANRWMETNRDVQIKLVEPYGDIHIDWKRMHELNFVYEYHEGTMDIVLGSKDCNSPPRWNQYSLETISDETAHQIGHYLGLRHSVNENHLMWSGEKGFTPTSFDNLEYDIPTSYSKYASWVEWDELEEQRIRFQSTGNIPAYNQIISKMNCIADVTP
jgi:hypothetical protein